MFSKLYFYLQQRKVLFEGKQDITPQLGRQMFNKLNSGYYTEQEEALILKLLVKKSFISKRHGEYEFIKKDKPYVPNRISRNMRFGMFVFALALGGMGLYAWQTGYFYLPGRRGGTDIVGSAITPFVTAMGCFSLLVFTAIIDHYDTRDNEYVYNFIYKTLFFLGWGMLLLSIILGNRV
ncbi:hypothetical protein [Vibrio sp. LaRot3]|uniref:hypothetical protein n=1 Tax=Vibrio sp. LaRot3 TaxID=2998829 RepID=UPI0022CDD78C|nr:hypothetical protein [Vibrio sp. LaRot3]MDA0147375.1 hypothetical protein [Vibrio sp. LaRot3]